MPTPFRIATFNCENLFNRPRIFNESSARSKQLLGYVAQLKDELSQPVFDQKQISALKKKLKGYVTINDIRNKHYGKKNIGSSEWVGTIELIRDPITDSPVTNTARVIADVNADVFCLIEIENRPNLQRLHDTFILKRFLEPAGKKPYEYILLIDGNDDRGIDVAVMSRFPILQIHTHIFEKENYMGKTVLRFSRDCLELEIEMPGHNKPLQLLVNHFKSMGYNPKNDPHGDDRRLAQAKRVAELADQHDLQNEYVVVAGDLNSPPQSKSLEPLLSDPGLYNVNLELPPDKQGTYKTSSQQLDYLIISQALKAKLKKVDIWRKGIYSTKWAYYDDSISQVTKSDATWASDHAAVLADFAL